MKWRDINRRQKNLLEEMRTKGPYEILEVSNSASTEEIQRAYKRLMMIYHPDKTGHFLYNTNESITKLINNAYEAIMKEKNDRR